MDWRVKAIVQKTLSVVPGGVQINGLLQRCLGDLRRFPDHVEIRIRDAERLIPLVRRLGLELSGLEICEVGTGWLPVLPVCFSISGIWHCTTFDIQRHILPQLTLRMVALLEQALQRISAASARSLEDVATAYAEIAAPSSVDELLDRARITYRAPADGGATGLACGSQDLVFSNNVLQYVPADAILPIMRESKRILRPGGLSLHSINCGDEYANFDPNITDMNFLKFSEEEWKFWNTSFIFQNRMRPVDFIRVAEEAGLELIHADVKVSEESLAALPHFPIHPTFQKYPPEQLCSTCACLAFRKN
ncbi:MAG: class I SAM-dependent methyltransferase [Acidobacteria bacterium]|nr:class I SAM-dependent methyltransferase [Acidobacteriota bacterium]